MKRFLVGAALLCLYVPSLGAYVVPDGSPVRWRCPGKAGVVAVTSLNKAAGNPFGTGPVGTFNDPVYAARYGRPSADLCNGVRPTFLIYAEGKDSQLQGDMQQACLRGEEAFQDQRIWDCWPGPNRGHGESIEVEDYAAVVGVSPKPGAAGGGNSVPGVPAIIALSSPGPGLVAVTWQTRAGHDHFLVQAGSGFRQIPGGSTTRYSTIVEVPPGEGGRVEVTVRASMGGPLGKASAVKVVNVEPRPAAPAPPPVKPDPPPSPPVEPPVAPPVVAPGGVCLEIPGQAGSRLLVRVVPAEECKP
jgi:hypothetical protein